MTRPQTARIRGCMPTYEYACPDCGGFTAVKRMAQYQDPQPCPRCGTESPRVTLTMPAFKGMSASNSSSTATANAAKGMLSGAGGGGGYRHMGGCSCC